MEIDYKLVYLFIIGMFLSMLFYLEELITENVIVEKVGLLKASILVIINSFIGGVVMVTVYYGLMEFVPNWHEYLRVGIAGTTAMLGKDMIRLYYKFIALKAEK